MTTLRYAPDFQININGQPIPMAMRHMITNVRCQNGLEGADRVEFGLVNEGLRWLDHPLLKLDNAIDLSIGYAPDPLQRVFSGEIVGQDASFPASGVATLNITAQSRMQRLQQGGKARWFAAPIPTVGNAPLPDLAVLSAVGIEHGLTPISDPVSAAISVLIGGAQAAMAMENPDVMQKLIRRQNGDTDFNFLSQIARENGWEMMIEHNGAFPGYELHFFSPLEHLNPEIELKYGKSLVDFSPRISSVGQITSISVVIWVPKIKTQFTVTAGYDWDRQSLDLSISPGFGIPVKQDANKTDRGFTLVDEPLTPASAPRVILGKLIPRLNQRLTGSGSTVGDPRIAAGKVIRLLGLGEQFSGLYRVTSATHSIDTSGYRTSFEVRKEIWFGSIPLPEQGAVPIRINGASL